MDRYLFRGLRTDGEGWVYGNLVVANDNKAAHIYQWKQNIKTSYIHEIVEVIPETVGQWTGLTYQSFANPDEVITEKVFQGDKFRYRLNGRYYVSIVILYNGCFGFMENSYFFPLYTLADSEGDLDYFEVIGNIHQEAK